MKNIASLRKSSHSHGGCHIKRSWNFHLPTLNVFWLENMSLSFANNFKPPKVFADVQKKSGKICVSPRISYKCQTEPSWYAALQLQKKGDPSKTNLGIAVYQYNHHQDTVDGSFEIRRENHLRLVVLSHNLQGFSTIPAGVVKVFFRRKKPQGFPGKPTSHGLSFRGQGGGAVAHLFVYCEVFCLNKQHEWRF